MNLIEKIKGYVKNRYANYSDCLFVIIIFLFLLSLFIFITYKNDSQMIKIYNERDLLFTILGCTLSLIGFLITGLGLLLNTNKVQNIRKNSTKLFFEMVHVFLINITINIVILIISLFYILLDIDFNSQIYLAQFHLYLLFISVAYIMMSVKLIKEIFIE